MRLTLIPAALAAVALAGCASAAPGASAVATTVPASCAASYAAWKTGTAAANRQFSAAMTAFSDAAGKDAITAAQARALIRTSKAAEKTPPPACADPAGYWGVMMANLITAGTAAEGGGPGAALGAITPMQNAVTAVTELQAELSRTAGVRF